MSSTILSDVVYDLNNRYPNLTELPKGRFLGINESNYLTEDGHILTIFISDDEKHTLVLSETLSLIIYNGTVKHWFSSLSKELTELLVMFGIEQTYEYGVSTTWKSLVNGNKIIRTHYDITYYSGEYKLVYILKDREVTIYRGEDNHVILAKYNFLSTANWRVELINSVSYFINILARKENV